MLFAEAPKVIRQVRGKIIIRHEEMSAVTPTRSPRIPHDEITLVNGAAGIDDHGLNRPPIGKRVRVFVSDRRDRVPAVIPFLLHVRHDDNARAFRVLAFKRFKNHESKSEGKPGRDARFHFGNIFEPEIIRDAMLDRFGFCLIAWPLKEITVLVWVKGFPAKADAPQALDAVSKESAAILIERPNHFALKPVKEKPRRWVILARVKLLGTLTLFFQLPDLVKIENPAKRIRRAASNRPLVIDGRHIRAQVALFGRKGERDCCFRK